MNKELKKLKALFKYIFVFKSPRGSYGRKK